MSWFKDRCYNAYLKKGMSELEASLLANEKEESRKQGVRKAAENRSHEERKAISQRGAEKRRGQTRTVEAKKRIQEGVRKFREENPEKIKTTYEKGRETVRNKTPEEKRKISEQKSKQWKEWWSDPKNEDKIKERNKKLSEAGTGKIRTEESKRKQSIANIGKKQSIETKLKRAAIREKKIAEGKSLGLRCKIYNIEGRFCQGTWEKRYIEGLIKDNKQLPENGKYYSTPLGIYQADFEFEDRIIEIKSPFTYDILLGTAPNIDGHYNKVQLEKLRWVSLNIKRVELLVYIG